MAPDPSDVAAATRLVERAQAPLQDLARAMVRERRDLDALLFSLFEAGPTAPAFDARTMRSAPGVIVSRGLRRRFAESLPEDSTLRAALDELPARRHVRCVVRLRRDERTLFALVQVPIVLEPVTLERDPAHPGCGAQRLAGELVGLSLTAACIAINDGYAHLEIDPRTARPTRRERGLSDPGAWRVAPADAARLGWGAEADNAKLLPTWRAAPIERRVQARPEAPALRLVPAPEVTRG